MAAEIASQGSGATFDSRVLEQLACPVCFGDLRGVEGGVVCAGCGRVYPLIGGIPVLIAERATPSSSLR